MNANIFINDDSCSGKKARWIIWMSIHVCLCVLYVLNVSIFWKMNISYYLCYCYYGWGTTIAADIARDIFRALFVDDLAIWFRGRSLDTIDTFTACSECNTGIGDKEWFKVCSPKNAKIYILLHPDLGLRDPLKSRLATLFCQWRSQRSSLGCGGTRTSFSRSTSMYWRHSARRLSTSSEWLLIWSGEETETHFWCCTGPLFAPSLTMVASCMAQHRIPIYGNWTASTIQDWDWPCELSAPAQSPACTKRPTKLILRNLG